MNIMGADAADAAATMNDAILRAVEVKAGRAAVRAASRAKVNTAAASSAAAASNRARDLAARTIAACRGAATRVMAPATPDGAGAIPAMAAASKVKQHSAVVSMA